MQPQVHPQPVCSRLSASLPTHPLPLPAIPTATPSVGARARATALTPAVALAPTIPVALMFSRSPPPVPH